MSENADANYVASLKFGAGHEAPWLVVRADTEADLIARLTQVGSGLAGVVAAAAANAQAEWKHEQGGPVPAGNNPGAVATVQQQVGGNVTPIGAAPSAAPASGPVCAHGPMKHITGNGAKGPWGGWFCPLPKGTPGACQVIWDKK